MQLPSDSALASMVRRAQAHDINAFEQLYTVFADPLYRYCYLRSGDSAKAQQLVGDIFAQMAQGVRQYRLPKQAHASDLCGWIFRLAEQQLATAATSQATSQLPSPADRDDEAPSEPPAASRLRDLIKTLPPEQQQVVLLRCVEHRSAAEVALILGTTIGRVRAMQRSALATLAGRGETASHPAPAAEVETRQ